VLTAGGDGVLRLEFIDELREEDWDTDSDGLGEEVELPMLDRTNSSNNMAASSDLDNNISIYKIFETVLSFPLRHKPSPDEI